MAGSAARNCWRNSSNCVTMVSSAIRSTSLSLFADSKIEKSTYFFTREYFKYDFKNNMRLYQLNWSRSLNSFRLGHHHHHHRIMMIPDDKSSTIHLITTELRVVILKINLFSLCAGDYRMQIRFTGAASLVPSTAKTRIMCVDFVSHHGPKTKTAVVPRCLWNPFGHSLVRSCFVTISV